MNAKYKSQNVISVIIFGIYLGVVFITLYSMKSDLLGVFAARKGYIRLIELLMILAVIWECFCLKGVCHKWSDAKKGFAIFIIALSVRLVCLFLSEEYVPTSDFNNYFLGACHFAENGFAGGASEALEGYGLPSFAGQAIINGLILNILSPTLLGMQILNAIYTSGICLMIFVIGKEVNAKAGMIGAVFYTFYPCSVLATQVTSNHHGAALFILLGVYFYFSGLKQRKVKERVSFTILSAVCLVISNYYHPSVIIVLCAFGVYMFVHELEIFINMPSVYIKKLREDIKKFTGVFIVTVALITLYICIYGSTITIITKSGYYKSADDFPLMGKFVVGFNFEYGGGYNPVDWDYILSFPKEERTRVSYELVVDRIKQHGMKETVDLMIQKNRRAWFQGDNYFSAYQSGIRANLTEKIEKTTDVVLKEAYEQQLEAVRYGVAYLTTADNFFVLIIWILALIGIIKILFTYKDDNLIYMLMYIPLGWMAFVMISEMQSRYRYQGMTVIVLVAGFGAEAVSNGVRKVYRHFRDIKSGGRRKGDE